MDWSEGYVSGIEYPAYFFRRQSPAFLNFACILNGVEPVPLDKPFTYFELGCGRGLTSNILAASNPQGKFYAADFNAAHIAGARQLASAAGLDNLTLLENSFAELADSKVALPQFDFITMQGVYTWVNAENRQHIVNFMARYLKPGGIVFVSYDPMPGWAGVLPVQRLLLEHTALSRDSRMGIKQGQQFIDRLIGMNAAYFTSNATPTLEMRLALLRDEDPKYLAHEYLNQGWQPLYHVDVARDFSAAKLDYVGSARLERAFPELCLTPDQQTLLASIPDASLRETVHDYLFNTQFRQDLFVRGARRLTPAKQANWLQQTGVALTVLRKDAIEDIQSITTLSPSVQETLISVINSLAEAPRTLLELAEMPELADMSLAMVAQTMAPFIDRNQVVPYFTCSTDMDSAPAKRINRAIAESSRLGDDYRALASSFLGTGVSVRLPHLVVYRALCQQEVDIDKLIDEIWEFMTARDYNTPDEQPIESLEELAETVAIILEQRVSVWQQWKAL